MLIAGTTAATTPEIMPEISSKVTRIDRSRFFSRQVSWKNFTIGANIYATTKLIRKGNNTPIEWCIIEIGRASCRERVFV